MPTFIPKENHGFEPKNVVKYMLFAAKTKSMLSSEFSIFNCTYCLMVYRMLLRCFKMKMIGNYQLRFCKGQIIYKILSFLQIFCTFIKTTCFISIIESMAVLMFERIAVNYAFIFEKYSDLPI